ncbi:alpha/beta hydrolase [Microbaculum marinum]|uniref:Alpha/beta hydrolase n=1 Tax=Microbaculum marinum TaxID=1764581 RepID=A0AAW9RFN0_9HYPH
MSVPIVLLSGVGSDCRMFDPVVGRLGGDFEIIAWDMPGYGGKPLDGAFSFADLAAGVIAELDGRGIDKAIPLGHSIGGMVAQEIAALHPDRISALILSGTTPVFGSRDGSFQEAFLKARLGPLDAGRTMADLAREAATSLVGPDPDPAAGPAIEALMADLPEESYRAGLTCLVTFNRRAELERIAVPTLLIAGDEDGNAPLKTMARMAELIAGARLEVLDKTGHMAPLECPDRFADAVRTFLESLPEDVK